MAKQKPRLPIMPPKGAATNLRRGGAHRGEQDRPRSFRNRRAIEDSRESF